MYKSDNNSKQISKESTLWSSQPSEAHLNFEVLQSIITELHTWHAGSPGRSGYSPVALTASATYEE